MHRSDCNKVVAFSFKVIGVAPTATPESVCRMLSYAVELARLNQLDTEHGLTPAQQARRLSMIHAAGEIAEKWGGGVRFYPRPAASPLIFAKDERAITVPVVY